MIDTLENKIHNATLDVGFDRISETGLNADWVVEWSKEYIFELIDRYAVELTKDDTVVKIPDLTIQLDLTFENNLLEESDRLRAEIGRQIKKALQKSILENSKNALSIAAYKTQIILDFIEYGQLSQSYSSAEWRKLKDVFTDELLSMRSFQDQFLEIIKVEDAFYRFYDLIELKALDYILTNWSAEKDLLKWIAAVSQLVAINPMYFKRTPVVNIYYKLFLDLRGKKSSPQVTLKNILSKSLIPETLEFEKLRIPNDMPRQILQELKVESIKQERKKRKVSNLNKSEKVQKIPEEGAHIGQAGLVLIASFLPAFLKNVGYVDDKGQLLSQKLVPILLHYLATGEIEAPEWKLTLPKILAGLYPGQHCETKITKNKKLDRQIDDLLQSIIGHWKELKKTSPEGLRNTFLIREGKLHDKNGFYYLYVREQTVDILLAYVSWNYQTIKLDWMKQILFVEWNKES